MEIPSGNAGQFVCEGQRVKVKVKVKVRAAKCEILYSCKVELQSKEDITVNCVHVEFSAMVDRMV